jgi:ABC-type antimicrobial peptide transport system permease subunit
LIHIKQILHKASLLIILFAAVAALFTLCFSSIAAYYYSQTVWPDFLSGQHITAKIQQWQEDTGTTVKIKDLINYCKIRDDNFILYKDYQMTQGRAVYLGGNTSFNPELVEGRNFTQEDFEKQTPTVLIAEMLNDRCILKEGKQYFLHENNEYQVIGKFRRGPYRQYVEQDKFDATYFVNMAASFDTNLNTTLNGNYNIDAKEKSLEFLKAFASLARQINPYIRIDVKEVTIVSNTQKLLQALNNSIKLVSVFILTAFLILLNISSITNYWIEGRKKELSLRMLSGGKPPAIIKMMLRDYLLIVTIGYGFGLLIGIIILHSETFSFIGGTIYPAVVIVGYVTCLAIGIIAGSISLTKRLKQNIILQMRG